MLPDLAKHSVLHNRGDFIWLSGDVSDDHRERLPREWRDYKLKKIKTKEIKQKYFNYFLKVT